MRLGGYSCAYKNYFGAAPLAMRCVSGSKVAKGYWTNEGWTNEGDIQKSASYPGNENLPVRCIKRTGSLSSGFLAGPSAWQDELHVAFGDANYDGDESE